MSYLKLSETWLSYEEAHFVESYNTKKLFYVHIPKTGGTLIENLFKDYHLGRFYKEWSSLECINKNISYWHVLPSDFKQLDFSKLNVFTSVRDPIQKILSEFEWQKALKNKMCDKYNEINEWIVESLKLHEQDNSTADNHFEPQIKFIVDYYGNTIPYDNMIICDKYNYHKNINNFIERNKLKIKDYDKAIDNIPNVHSNRKGYDDLYTQLEPETIQLIKNYYRGDFILLEKVKKHYEEKGWLSYD